MKINAIKNTNFKNYQTKTNAIKQTFNYPKDSFTLSFGAKKAKHSNEFIELTKNDKYLQVRLKELCMLDENGEFNPEYEKYFLDLVRSLSEEEKNDPSLLRNFALAIGTARRLNYDEEAIHYLLGNIFALKKYDYLDNEIEFLFRSKDFNLTLPPAYIVMQDLLKDNMDFDEKTYFLTKFCKKPDGSTDSERIAGLIELFSLLQPQYESVSEKILNMLLDEDGNFNMTKCAFALDCINSIYGYVLAKDENFVKFVQEDGEQATAILISTLKKLIAQNEEENGEFDIEKAKETFSAWYDYVKENKQHLSRTLYVNVYDVCENKESKMPIEELIKKYPNKEIYFNNTVYMLSSLITNPYGKTN